MTQVIKRPCWFCSCELHFCMYVCIMGFVVFSCLPYIKILKSYPKARFALNQSVRVRLKDCHRFGNEAHKQCDLIHGCCNATLSEGKLFGQRYTFKLTPSYYKVIN